MAAVDEHRTHDQRRREGVTATAASTIQRAVDRVRQLEVELDATFESLLRAMRDGRDAGLEFTVQMEAPVQAAWSKWAEQRPPDEADD